MFIPVNGKQILSGAEVISYALASAVMKGSVHGLANEDPEIIFSEEFAIKFNEDRANQATALAVSSTVFMAGTWWLSAKYSMGERLKLITPMLEVMTSIVDDIVELAAELARTTPSDNVTYEVARLNTATRKLDLISTSVQYLDSTGVGTQERLNMNKLLATTEYSDLLNDEAKLQSIFAEMKLFMKKPLIPNQTQKLMVEMLSSRSLFGFSAISGETSRIVEMALNVDPFRIFNEFNPSDEWKVLSSKINRSKANMQQVKILSRSAKTAGWLAKINIYDLVFWVISTGIDLALNPFMPEEEQKIPILSSIPWFGRLFDWSESVGTSPIQSLIIEPMIEASFEFFVGEEPEDYYSAMVAMMLLASRSETLEGMVGTVLSFWYSDLEYTGEVILGIDTSHSVTDMLLLRSNLSADPLIILELFTYAIVGKMVYTYWLKPLAQQMVASQ